MGDFEIEEEDENSLPTIERQIAIASIVSKNFLSEIKHIFARTSVKNQFIKIIVEWSIEYFDKFDNSPKENIQDILKAKEGLISESQSSAVKKFLESISDEIGRIQDINYKYILDKAEKYFRVNSLIELKENIEKLTKQNKIEEAENLVVDFNKISLAKRNLITDPFIDEQAILRAFQKEKNEGLFEFDGHLGKMVGRLSRGSLVAFVAKPGVGKTWWLLNVAVRAVLSGHNVLFASFEMSESEIVRRIYQMNAGMPFSHDYDKDEENPDKDFTYINTPQLDCKNNQENTCNKEIRTCNFGIKKDGKNFSYAMMDKETLKKYKVCKICDGASGYELVIHKTKKKVEYLSEKSAMREQAGVRKTLRGNQFKIVEYPNNTITMREFASHIQNLEYYENFIPDIIITDYADKFKLSTGRQEYRLQVKEIWEGHKAMAQEKNCLVVTASQTNATRESDKDISQGDWAESISKLELIDVGIAVNQKKSERRNGIVRLAKIKDRHSSFSLLNECIVLQNLEVGAVCLESYYEENNLST